MRRCTQNLRRLLGAALWLAMSGGAAAEGPPELPAITLREALQRALRDAPTVAAAAAAHATREAESSAADARYYPALTAQGSGGYVYDNRLVAPEVPRIDSESLSAQASVQLEWVALDFARGSHSDAAEAAARAQGLEAQVARRDALLLATESYVMAAAAAALREDAELNLARRSSQQNAIEQLVRAGTRAPVDLARAKVETLSAQYAVEARRNEQLAACAALAAAIGRPATDPVCARAGDLPALELEPSPGRAQATARADHPELRSQEALIAARREQYSAAIGARLPTVGILGNASISYLDVRRGVGIDGHLYGGSALVYLRWSGIDPSVWLQAGVASAAVAEAQRELAVRRHAIAGEAAAAAHALSGAKIELERAVAVLKAVEETREAQNGRYLAGVASLLDLLDAEEREQLARRQRIEAQRDYHLASARLLWLNGKLGDLAR